MKSSSFLIFKGVLQSQINMSLKSSSFFSLFKGSGPLLVAAYVKELVNYIEPCLNLHTNPLLILKPCIIDFIPSEPCFVPCLEFPLLYHIIHSISMRQIRFRVARFIYRENKGVLSLVADSHRSIRRSIIYIYQNKGSLVGT